MVNEAIGGSRWKPTFRTCKSWEETQEGITDFVKRHRDLPYCRNEGCREECKSCAANKCNGYGTNSKPPIRFTKGYSSPF
jgi:hypothetical protein